MFFLALLCTKCNFCSSHHYLNGMVRFPSQNLLEFQGNAGRVKSLLILTIEEGGTNFVSNIKVIRNAVVTE